MNRRWLIAAALLLSACASTPKRFDVALVTDEADAVLNILDKRAASKPIADADWHRLFSSEGFVRLKKREASMKRSFDEETMRKFVLSDELLARREMLARVVSDWRHADFRRASQLALAYLPKTATIRAKVYPVIKPQTNSFVFEVDTDPAIFKYVEDEPRAEFERTMAHEFHHIGYGTACRNEPPITWIGAFGEGFAVLAAAGGPDRPPQARHLAEWNAEMAKLDENFKALDAFLTDVAAHRISGDAETQRAFSFFGMLGPWYTVGWKMATVIETTLGRDALINAMCDARTLLPTYNRAAALYEQRTGEKLPRWSEQLVSALGPQASDLRPAATP